MSEAVAKRPKPVKRAFSGFIVLDKPLHFSSNQALQRIKHLLMAKKAGHTGSLDPLATGVLPLCFGDATKLSQYLLDADKTYEVEATLGIQTQTGDAEGDVIQEAPLPEGWRQNLASTLDCFLGETTQIPSMFSALKHQGKPLYELARQGIEVERPPRTIFIHDIAVLTTTGNTFTFTVSCSKGTYVRTLVEDIAVKLGTVGYVSALRRTQAGPYGAGDMVTLATLEEAYTQGGFDAVKRFIRPLESALCHWPSVNLTALSAHYLRQGQSVRVPGLPDSGLVRLFNEHHRFLGLGEISDEGKVAPKRLISETSEVI